MDEPRAPHEDGSSEYDTPIGVLATCLLVGVYGVLWSLSSLHALGAEQDPGLVTVLGPLVGLALLLVAHGLWQLRWTAWAVTVSLGWLVILRDLLQLVAFTVESIPVVPLLVVGYLMVRDDLFFESSSV